MSKKKGARKKRRRRSPRDAKGRLHAIAAALNNAERAGMRLHAGAGAVFADEGAVLRFKGGTWAPRMFVRSKDTPEGQPDDLDD